MLNTNADLPRDPPAGWGARLTRSLSDQWRLISKLVNDLAEEIMPLASHSSAITADALVYTGRCVYYGVTVTTATATAAIDIRDAVSAGAGTILETLPATTAVGVRERGVGVVCETGLYVDFGASATGTLIVHFRAL